ncbi:MAG: (Fe-S)-binding protein [Actinomycetales bacterium]
MHAVKAVAIVVSLVVTVVALALVARAARSIIGILHLGAPDGSRSGQRGERTKAMLRETLGHSRMLQWSLVGSAHWFVFIGFGALFFTLVTAYGQLFAPDFALPLIGHWVVYEWATELIAWLTGLGILTLIGIRLRNLPGRGPRVSRFAGSTFWQAYYVESTIVAIVLCVLALRGLEYVQAGESGWSVDFPTTWWLGSLFSSFSRSSVDTAVVVIAAIKILVSMAWFIVIATNLTMGIAWHRFTAWFNIFFKRHPDRTALGELPPISVAGKPVDFEDIDSLDEDASLGVGKVEDFTWKGLLDFTTCTECGRCQSQCPAWNTSKPLSPKLVILGLRDHAYAKAPYLQAARAATAGGTDSGVRESDKVPAVDFGPEVMNEVERPLVGTLDERGVIDPDVLWSCTTCGACVQQCPVDIEHVDHIVNMRRYQVLMESSYPSELGGLFKNLENKGNPWGVGQNQRLEWAKGLPFDVRVVGEDVEDLSDVEWLFWVGCAGAFEDRQKKTTRAVAELLHTAGVDFAVLGTGETCTGDPARRAANEFLFQQLAMENAETLKEAKARKVVATCAHCFNTLKNEYAQLGVELEVVHHTQLLNRLVREGKLTPVKPVTESAAGPQVTYHDPCYLGRHNGVYAPPRELIGSLPGVEYREMPRNSERSFCCGAGGARMWMEEKIGTRINANRTAEAVATGAKQIAVGCPFCRVMLSDGLTAAQADGAAGEDVSVVDVATLLLEAVRRGDGGVEQGEPVPAGQP